MEKLLSVRERHDIRKRNPDNKDVELLLAEGEELRKLLTDAEKENEVLGTLMDEFRAQIN